MQRRSFLRLTAMSSGLLALGPGFWRSVYAAPARPGPGPYGAISGAPDAQGLRLPAGFSSRIVARTGQRVPGTPYTWHAAPDGGTCFPTDDGGWVYTSNCELPLIGGASSIRFDGGGNVTSAYRILEGTQLNCAGGPRPGAPGCPVRSGTGAMSGNAIPRNPHRA